MRCWDVVSRVNQLFSQSHPDELDNPRGGVLGLKRDDSMVACEVWTKLNSGDKASRESKTSDEGKWMMDEEDLSGKGVIDVLWDKYQIFDLGVIKFPFALVPEEET